MTPDLNLSAFLLPTKTHLRDVPTKHNSVYSDESIEASITEIEKQMLSLHEKIFVRRRYALLILIHGLDASGKDRTMRLLARGSFPTQIKFAAFKKPSQEEEEFDFLRRYHVCLPARGMVGVFTRSYYDDLIHSRLNQSNSEAILRLQDHVRNFELLMSDSGTEIMRLYLHISQDEQGRRLKGRREAKMWKLTPADMESHREWTSLTNATDETLRATKDSAW